MNEHIRLSESQVESQESQNKQLMPMESLQQNLNVCTKILESIYLYVSLSGSFLFLLTGPSHQFNDTESVEFI